MRRLVAFSLLSVLLLGGVLIVLLSASIYTFSVLTDETLIAELTFEETGDRQYLAYLRTGDRCTERVLPVLGEQWRVDAEFLKWKYWAMLFGLESQYRLDRLEGRYRSIADQNTSPTLAHDLAGGTALDVVEVAGALGSWNFLIDATYGSSTYQDIDTTNVHYVYRTPTGIITRSAPRPVRDTAAGLDIDIDRACGAPPPLWKRTVTWVDGAVVGALAWLGR